MKLHKMRSKTAKIRDKKKDTQGKKMEALLGQEVAGGTRGSKHTKEKRKKKKKEQIRTNMNKIRKTTTRVTEEPQPM